MPKPQETEAGTDEAGSYASPPCYAHEVDPAYFDPQGVDPQQAKDVARWRKAERARLLDARKAMSVEARGVAGGAMLGHVRDLIADRIGALEGCCLSAFWPIKGEVDLRALLTDWHEAGATACLPVVETRFAPLVFRRWTPETEMIRGDWNIPVPSPDVERVLPDVLLAPLVGWDDAGYRLGYGGGYFDRTLAALGPRRLVIGVGFQAARLATIYPQPHDIPLDAIVTEAGVQVIDRPRCNAQSANRSAR
ncbi:MAG: 5-formyltetrahydrofolate cyclo-ligase [Paracoccaceae bacterium]|nr:5-formyltetrahydrofolate cyclo-ligase [Paracoccaceae bacterium]